MRITVAQTINLGWDCVAPSALFRWNMSANGAVRRGEWAMSPERAVFLFSPWRRCAVAFRPKRRMHSLKSKQAPFQVPVFLEATVGIEPTYKGFADPRLTTWPRRLNGLNYTTGEGREEGRE